MAEYIDREALIKALEADFNTDWADYASKNNFDKDYIDGVRDEYDDVLKIICKQPAADVQPVKHGRWSECYTDTHHYSGICSVCGKASIKSLTESLYEYCPKCGARMIKDGDTD